jgi:glycogen synthase
LGRNESLQGEGRVTAIRNGIDSDHFDVANKEVFKELALERTFDTEGNETTNYVAYRAKLKQLLFRAGLIANPSLPLVVYVGRYSGEKGVDVLANVIQKADRSRVQFVSMGIQCNQPHLVAPLQKMASSSHQKSFRCYTTKEQQTAPFTLEGTTYSITVGQMMRAAADISIVPSHAEACGLVAMEGQCAGSLLIAPYHQGLRDICKPDGYDDGKGSTYSLKKNANAICYREHTDSKQTCAALTKALDFWWQRSDAEKNQFARRIRNDAIPNYSWYYKDEKRKIVTGASVAYHQLYEELAAKKTSPQTNEEGFRLEPPVQAPIIPVPLTHRSLLSRIALRIATWARYFFSYLAEMFRSKYRSFKAYLVQAFSLRPALATSALP